MPQSSSTSEDDNHREDKEGRGDGEEDEEEILLSTVTLEEENRNLSKTIFRIRGHNIHYARPEDQEWDHTKQQFVAAYQNLDNPTFIVHLNELEGRIERRKDKTYVFVPISLTQIIQKYPFPERFPDKETDALVAAQTNHYLGHKFDFGNETLNASYNTKRGLKSLPKYDFKSDPFLQSRVDFDKYPYSIEGNYKLSELFKVATKENLVPTPCILDHSVAINTRQSFHIANYKGDPNALLQVTVFTPRNYAIWQWAVLFQVRKNSS